MIKTLLKKQMMELFSFLWQDRKKNQKRTGSKLVLYVIFYVFLFVMLGFMFYTLSASLCAPLVQAGMGWMYFALMGLLGVIMGAFGSIFSTYTSLYTAKDNEFLMAMPIPPAKLLPVRMAGVYAMGLMYELLVMIPVLIEYYITAGAGFGTVISSVLVTFLLSVFILTLCVVLGWGVAMISSRVKHKSMITVALSLLFISAYYYLYIRAAGMLQDIIARPQEAGAFIRGRFSPLYHMGMAAQGNPVSLLILAGEILALFAVVYVILSKTYLKIVTTNRGEAKVKYKERRLEARSVENALLGKEFRRFLGSPNYMLNCGLGIVLMVVSAIALLIKADMVKEVVAMVFEGYEEMLMLLAAAALCMFTTMNDITAPSVSLEGKNLWLVQSFPVSGRQVLMAKLKLHLILTLIPAVILTASVEFVLAPPPVFAILIPVVLVIYVLFMALLGLCLNLKMPNLTWTNEVVPIKQSMCVMIALFGGWVIVLALGGLYVLLAEILPPAVYLLLAALLLAAGSAIMVRWIRHRGARIFETL